MEAAAWQSGQRCARQLSRHPLGSKREVRRLNSFGVLAVLGASIAGLIMLLFPRPTRHLGVCLLIAMGTFSFLDYRRESRFTAGFEAVRPGMHKQAVLDLMGSASEQTDGTISVFGDTRKPPTELTEGCVLELWWNSFFFPERLAVCFSSSGEVLHKAAYSSY